MEKVIAYKNPAQAHFYESGMHNFLLLCLLVGFIVFILIECIVSYTKDSRFKILRNIDCYKGHIILILTLATSAYAYYVIYW